MTPRQQATEFALGYITRMDPSGINTKIIAEQLASLSDKDFGELMDSFSKDEGTLTFEAPVFSNVHINIETNIEIAKELGYSFFQQLVFGSEDPSTPSYVSPPKYFIVPCPVRRTIQFQEKGVSVAKDNNSVDPRTGAVTNSSATSKISYPEQGILDGMGMTETIKEMASVRGGDTGAWQAYEAMMARDGEASLKQLEHYSTGVESVKSYSRLLTAMHIRNNF